MIITTSTTRKSKDGLRPINLSTDLGQLADLIEHAFRQTMDASGKAAIQEMRHLSKIGGGLRLFGGLNNLAQGISLGFVWVENHQIVGNVSIYPAPDLPSDMGRTYIIANVAVYPDCRGKGIASRLMEASLQHIHERGGRRILLQVDMDNNVAHHLYHKMGFRDERAWIQWRRRGMVAPVLDYPSHQHAFYLRRYRNKDWKQVYQLAQQVRSQRQGGIDWLRPCHPQTFLTPLTKQVTNFLNMIQVERLVLEDLSSQTLSGWLQFESQLALSTHQVTLMTTPQPQVASLLLGNIVRRHTLQTLQLNHPYDDAITSAELESLHFKPTRHLINMVCTL
ncbi:MAG: GNAT family N-acetyltransferase [Phototrophicaceae bacterium]